MRQYTLFAPILRELLLILAILRIFTSIRAKLPYIAQIISILGLMPNQNGPVFSAKEVAAQICVHKLTLLRWLRDKDVRAKRFPNAFRVGVGANAQWRIPAGDIQSFKDQSTNNNAA